MNEAASIFFLKQRAEWMLKAPLPSKDHVEIQRTMDRNKNPHNDSYKPKLRSEAEIIADLTAELADSVLSHTYGQDYDRWLKRVRSPFGLNFDLIFPEEIPVD